jgi:hypothetical protein
MALLAVSRGAMSPDRPIEILRGENCMRRMSFALAAAAFAAVVSSTAAEAQSRTQVGVLDCRGGRTVGMILGSTTTLGCIFRSGRRVENYVATVNRLGLDVGITENVALAWTVFAPTQRLGRGDLSGNYAGAGASATVGFGGGANLLIGGSANSIALQPLSLQGQTGVNLAIGISSLQLRPR